MAEDHTRTSAIERLLRSLRRRIGIILICAVTVPAAAVGASLLQEKEYSASASLLFRQAGIDQQLFGVPLFTPRDPARDAATNEGLVSLDIVARRTARRLGPAITAASVSEKVEVEAQGQSDLVAITATDRDPAVAARMANLFAQEYIVFRRNADRNRVRDAQRLIKASVKRLTRTERNSERGQLLRERSEQLDTIARLQTGNAELVQTARPPASPSSPKPVRNGIIGAVGGLLLGIAFALLLERFDRRLRDPKDAEEIFARPILGAIPDSKQLPAADPSSLGGQEADAFRMLRANLRYFNVDRELKSLLITSAAPGDGKSTVAWHLGAISAASGSRVLLIEADLRHPVFAERYGISGGTGLSGLLAGDGALSQAATQIEVSPKRGGRAARTMDVLVAGPLPPNPTDLLESKRTKELIDAAEQDYDLVIIDTPPTSVVPDAIPLLTEVSGVLIVSRLGKSTRPPAIHLRHQLDNLDAPVLGVVINSLTSDAGGYYGYGYGYGYEAAVREDEESTRTPADDDTQPDQQADGDGPEEETSLGDTADPDSVKNMAATAPPNSANSNPAALPSPGQSRRKRRRKREPG